MLKFDFWKIPVFFVIVLCVASGIARAGDPVPPKLVIVKAVYGDLPDGDKTDVTTKVKAALNGNALTIDASNDNFDDPAVGVGKKLQVDYTLDGVKHTKTVAEGETLTISTEPSRTVIVKAVYGDLPDGNKTDVTTKVSDQLNGDSLSIDASNDNFGDPAEGTGKKLQVDYTFDGVKHTKTVNEGQTLIISTKPSSLVITKAVYGDLPDGDKTDVTAKVTDQINGDTLSVDASNDLFGDPAVGTGKKLQVDYTLDGKTGSKTVDEGATLTVPDAPDANQ